MHSVRPHRLIHEQVPTYTYIQVISWAIPLWDSPSRKTHAWIRYRQKITSFHFQMVKISQSQDQQWENAHSPSRPNPAVDKYEWMSNRVFHNGFCSGGDRRFLVPQVGPEGLLPTLIPWATSVIWSKSYTNEMQVSKCAGGMEQSNFKSRLECPKSFTQKKCIFKIHFGV